MHDLKQSAQIVVHVVAVVQDQLLHDLQRRMPAPSKTGNTLQRKKTGGENERKNKGKGMVKHQKKKNKPQTNREAVQGTML